MRGGERRATLKRSHPSGSRWGRLLIVGLAAACSGGDGGSAGRDVDGASGTWGDPTGATTKSFSCEVKGIDGEDSDCVAWALPRKLDCRTPADLDGALASGCRREDPDDPEDLDVCCPTSVQGVEPGPAQTRDAGSTSNRDVPTARPPDAAPLLNTVTCDETIRPGYASIGTTFCGCTASGGPIGPKYAGEECGEAKTRGQLCCADSTYPTSGACQCSIAASWMCVSSGARFRPPCECAFYFGVPAGWSQVTTCRAGNPAAARVCCARDRRSAGGIVECACVADAACAAGWRAVSECSTPEAIGVSRVATTCLGGRKAVSACSMNLIPPPQPPGGSNCRPDCLSSCGTSSSCVDLCCR